MCSFFMRMRSTKVKLKMKVKIVVVSMNRKNLLSNFAQLSSQIAYICDLKSVATNLCSDASI